MNGQTEGRSVSLLRSIIPFLVLSIVSMRFAIINAGGSQFPAALFIAWLFAATQFRKLGIDPANLLIFLGILGVGLISALFFSLDFVESFKTIAYVLMIYPLIGLKVSISEKDYRKAIETFQWTMVAAGAYGAIQFLTRLAWDKDFLEDVILAKILLRGYATKYPVFPAHLSLFGLPMFYKMNSFFPEPSICSQFFAFALILEIFFFRKFWRMGLYLLCILFSFSGSGFLMAALFGIFWLLLSLASMRIPKRLLYPMIALACLGVGMAAFMLINESARKFLFDRLSEFQTPDTSAYFRFVEPFRWGKEVLASPYAFLGIGPGMKNSSDWYFDFIVRDPNETTFFRILLEFGSIGLILYISLFARAYFTTRNAIKKILVLMLFCDLIGGGYFLSPFWGFTIFIFILRPERIPKCTPGALPS
jgi:hypothetical protein